MLDTDQDEYSCLRPILKTLQNYISPLIYLWIMTLYKSVILDRQLSKALREESPELMEHRWHLLFTLGEKKYSHYLFAI